MRPTIYFVSVDDNTPIGGIKVLYKHVDILNDNGINAFILRSKKGYRCTWFENQTKLAYIDEITILPQDIIVLPEVMLKFFDENYVKKGISRFIKKTFSKNSYRHRYRHFVMDLSGLPNRKVIYNQNAYYTFLFHPWQEYQNNPYKRSDIKAIICVSDDNKEYLNIALPWQTVHRVRLSVEPDLFYYSKEKENAICFLVNKSKPDVNQILNILQLNDKIKGYKIIPIDGYKEHEVAEIMRKSLIFLSFGPTEGFPLPPFEAAICGCIVIGYHGRGARESLLKEFSYPIEVGDIQGYVKAIYEVLELREKQPEVLVEKGRAASNYMLNNYNKTNEVADVIRVWNEILNTK